MMRIAMAATLGISLCGFARADDPAEILAKAVKASAGSEETLAKRRFCRLKQTGVIFLPQGAAIASREIIQDLPERLRWSGEMRTAAGNVSFVVVLNGLTGWAKAPTVREMSAKDYESARNEAYTMWLASLVPFRSRSIQWETQKDGVANGRPAYVLKATAANRPVVVLHIDKETLLVMKASYTGIESLANVTKEYVFSHHKDFDGQRLPGKVQVLENSRKIEEWTTDNCTFPTKIEDKEFGKP